MKLHLPDNAPAAVRHEGTRLRRAAATDADDGALAVALFRLLCAVTRDPPWRQMLRVGGGR